MFSHIMLGADDIDASKTFYDAIFAATGVGPGITDDKGRVFWMTPTGVFAITKPIDGKPASCGNGSTVGFAMKSPAEAAAFPPVPGSGLTQGSGHVIFIDSPTE